MLRKFAVAGSSVFLGLAVVALVAFWLVLFSGLGSIQREHASKLLVFLAVLAVVEVLSLLFVIRLVVRASRAAHWGFGWFALAVCCFLFCANALSYVFTPVFGGFGAMFAGLVAFAATPKPRRSSSFAGRWLLP